MAPGGRQALKQSPLTTNTLKQSPLTTNTLKQPPNTCRKLQDLQKHPIIMKYNPVIVLTR